MIFKGHYKGWLSKSGTPWPYRDEFETGCALELSGYYLTWFAGIFGPAKSVTSFASVQFADKETDKPLSHFAPDFTSACIEYSSGVVVRLTCSIVAPYDHSMCFIGDEGSIVVKDGVDYRCPVWIRPNRKDPERYKDIWVRLTKKLPFVWRSKVDPREIPLVKQPEKHYGASQRESPDYARGINELAESIQNNRACRLSPELALHINEIMLSLQYPERMGCPRQIETSFNPIEPMPWGR
jgi:predicted dehydrogenase